MAKELGELPGDRLGRQEGAVQVKGDDGFSGRHGCVVVVVGVAG